MIIDVHSDPYDDNNDLDDGGDENDGHDSLRSLFSPAKLDGDSLETDLGVDTVQDGLHKRLSEDVAPAAGRSRTGDSADTPIVVDGDVSAMELSDIAAPQSLEREQEPHRGFDERIPLSISDLNQGGRFKSDNGSDSDSITPFTFRKRKLGLEVGSLLSNISLSSHRKKTTMSRTERASVLREIGADANAAAIMTATGPWNEVTTHYPAFLLEATAAMLRELFLCTPISALARFRGAYS